MTTHRPHQRPNTCPLPDAFTADRGDSPGGTVPVIVWRTAAGGPASGNDSGLPGRLAHHLVAIYTAAGETIADLDTDDSLRDAAAVGARRYLRFTSPTELASYQPKPGQPITLIMIQWPRPVPVPDIRTLLAACKDILGPGGSIVVAVTAAAAGYPGTTFAAYERQLLPSAKAAGLRHLHDIVALTATGGRDIFSYATAPAELSTDGRDSDADSPCHGTATALIILDNMAVRP